MDKGHFVISGAASGIGLAVAQRLAGSSLVLVDRDERLLDAACESLSRAGAVTKVVLDLTSPTAKGTLSATFEPLKGTGGITGLVAAHGIQAPSSVGDDDAWHKTFSANLDGVRHLIEAALPTFARDRQHYARIVVLSSAAAALGVPGYGAYAASKAALESMVKTMAVECAATKILVNAVAPGWVETPLLASVKTDWAERSGVPVAAIEKSMRRMSPLLRTSTPDEIAELICFLLLSRQNSITGQTFAIDNGIGLTLR